jgi:hypothetical protein
MSQGKTSRGIGSAQPVEDADQIRRVLEDLRTAETEFPIKVEGTHTLPYTARIEALGADWMDLKLIRPLPHELGPGAPFEMLLATAEQRCRALVEFQGRQAYLRYRFILPVQLMPCDQRRHPRYPFRPRERAYVLAQDGTLPGYGLAGPLVNLSLGGLAFRVDRVLRLDDHLLIKPGLGFFERGKALPILKIHDLPKLPLFDARGKVAHACERGGEIIVGLQFGELNSTELAQLQEVLTLREHMKHAPASILAALVRDPRGGASAAEGPAGRVAPAGQENPQALRLLGRRTTDLLIAMAPGPARDQVFEALILAGYLRVEAVDSLSQAMAILRAERPSANRLFMAAAETLRPEERADILALQQDLGDLHDLPVALLGAAPPPQVPDPAEALIRNLPIPSTGAQDWLEALDELAGLM